MYGYNTATYESASTQRFKHARTDTVRSATIESDSFVRAMGQDSIPVRTCLCVLCIRLGQENVSL